MKYVTLVAHEKDESGNKVEIGREEGFPIAETVQDILDMETENKGWNAEEIVAAFNYGSRVKRQAQWKSGKEQPATVKAYKAATSEQKAKMDQLIAEFLAKGTVTS